MLQLDYTQMLYKEICAHANNIVHTVKYLVHASVMSIIQCMIG